MGLANEAMSIYVASLFTELEPHSDSLLSGQIEKVVGPARPTLQAIRDLLKSGSFATISRHLKTWKERRQSQQSSVPKVPEGILLMFNRVWELTFREAEKALENEREVFRVEKERWENEKSQIQEVIEKVEAERDHVAIKIIELERSVKTLTLQVSQFDQNSRSLGEDLARLKAQLEATELRRAEATERADRLESQLLNLASTNKG